jgi:hypothetical protein
MAKGSLGLEHLKKATITMSDAVNVESTKQLDGEAKDSPVMNENNETTQYSTGALPKGDLGGRDNKNG